MCKRNVSIFTNVSHVFFPFLIENIGFYEKNVKMKYILIIWVCSFIQGNACKAPMEYPTIYNSWYECSRDAHVESVKLLSKMGYKNVNDYKVGTKYHCKAIQTY